MVGLGLVCFAVLVVGGALLVTLAMTLLAMRQVAREELAVQNTRTEPAKRRRVVAPAPRPRDAAVLEVADRVASPVSR